MWVCLVVASGFLICTLLDQRLYVMIADLEWDRSENRDWEQAFRLAGFVPMWVAIGLGLLWARSGDAGCGCVARGRPLTQRALAWSVPLAALLSGVLAEICKGIFLRHRPSVENGGGYVFDWIDETRGGPGIGFASSHTAVAFGAAFLLWRYHRGVGVLALVIAAGCGAVRLLAGAHFVTDVYAAVVLAWFGSGVVWRIARVCGTPTPG